MLIFTILLFVGILLSIFILYFVITADYEKYKKRYDSEKLRELSNFMNKRKHILDDVPVITSFLLLVFSVMANWITVVYFVGCVFKIIREDRQTD